MGLSFFRAISGLGMDGMGWDLCAGLFYVHRFAMLIRQFPNSCDVWKGCSHLKLNLDSANSCRQTILKILHSWRYTRIVHPWRQTITRSGFDESVATVAFGKLFSHNFIIF